MNLFFFHRRRAERFAQLLDESGTHPDARAGEDRELRELLAVTGRLRRTGADPQADPEFRTDLRAMLMATIEREGIGASAVAPDAHPEFVRRPAATASMLAWIPIRSRRARGAVVVGLAVSALAVSGMSALSGSANPGDVLYGMKRSGERAQVALSSSQLGRGQLYLEFAKNRLTEAATGRGDVVTVLTEMDDETRQGVRLLTTAAVEQHDPASLDTIDTFVSGQRHTIAGMLDTLTGVARSRTVGSLQLLDQVTKRVDALRVSLGCGDLASAQADELGPVPGSCVAQSPPTSSVYGVPTGGAPVRDGATTAPRSATDVTSSGATSRGTTTNRPPMPASTTSSPQNGQPSDTGLLGSIARLLGIE